VTHYYGLDTVLPTDRIKVTQSDLASFKRDRRMWFLKTYLGLRPVYEKVVGPLVLGTLVHAALEARYLRGEDIEEAFRKATYEAEVEYRASAPYFNEAAWNKQAEMGRRMVEGYEQWLEEEHYDADITTVAVERLLQVETTYHGVPVVLSGKADHIVRDNLSGELLVYDWKTTNNFDRMIRQAHTTDQLPYYMTLQQTLEPSEHVSGAAFTMLLKTQRSDRAKPPFYRREVVRYTRAGLATRRAAIDGAISDYVRTALALHAGVDNPMRVAYPNPGVLAFDREFDDLNDIIDGGGNVEGMIRAHFTQVNPYARYETTPASMLDDN